MADQHTKEARESFARKKNNRPKKIVAGAFAAFMLTPAIALPAYAATEPLSSELTVSDLSAISEDQITEANLQTLTTGDYEDSVPDVLLEVKSEISEEWLAEQARLKAEAEAKAKREAEEAAQAERDAQAANQPAPTAKLGADIPAGVGAQGVVDAALAQIGVGQDCTDLVQNSLAAAGYTARRDQGGFDLGTGIWDYDRFGSRVSLDSLAPGDILIYGNAGSGAHVAIYVGNGKAVHGGWNGSTQIAGYNSVHLPLTGAVRPA